MILKQLARKIYSDKYNERMEFEKYLVALENGFSLLEDKATQRKCSKDERDAMRLALEYNLELMFERKQFM